MLWRRVGQVSLALALVAAGVMLPRVLHRLHFEDAPPLANAVRYIVLHHAASDAPEGRSAVSTDIDWRTIDAQHRARGFDMIGYHYLVRFDGTIEKGRAEDLRGAHARAWDTRGVSYNASSIGVCFAGNCDLSGWTEAQQEAGYRLLTELLRRYDLPPERVIGHRECGNVTNCPGGLIDLDAVRARLGRLLAQPVGEAPPPGSPIPPEGETPAPATTP